MNQTMFQFGSLQFGGTIQNIPTKPVSRGDVPEYDGVSAIIFKPTIKGRTITWLKPDGFNLLISDRVLLVDISWDDLNRNGFINGKEIQIDGRRFRCRLLQVGSNRSIDSEWNQVLDTTGEDDMLWHCDKMGFWGTDVAERDASYRAVRGLYSGYYFYSEEKSTRSKSIGFRPILEPLPSTRAIPNCTLDGEEFYLSVFPGGNAVCPVLQPVNNGVFAGVPDGQTVKMYSVIENGHPVPLYGTRNSVSQLELTDRYFGDEYLIPWVISNGLAVAERTLFHKV